MHPVTALEHLGGTAPYARLVALTTRADLDRLVRAGEVVRVARGRYALATVDEARRVGAALTGSVSHTSAALLWGWPVKAPPRLPHVTVPRGRVVPPQARRRAVLHYATLRADEVRDGVTDPGRTLTDCLRTLPYDEALVVADSALREGGVSTEGLAALAARLRGAGAARARLVAARADGRAANPFESVLRAISHEVPGLHLRPQVVIADADGYARPDLVDEDLWIVCEADSQTWHNSSRQQLRRDARRYNDLVIRGWWVLRFVWEDVMFRPDSVRETLRRLTQQAHQRPQVRNRPSARR